VNQVRDKEGSLRIRACFGFQGKRFLGHVLADKLRAMSWDNTKGTLNVVLSDNHQRTFHVEMSRDDVGKLLTYYTPGQIVNHFAGDMGRAEEWLQTSRKILNDPANLSERPEVSRNPGSLLKLGKRRSLEELQTSSRILQNRLWLQSGLEKAIFALKQKKVRLRAKKVQKRG
jgi:hypothetical protein